MKQIVYLFLLALLLSCGDDGLTGTSSEVDIEYANLKGYVANRDGGVVSGATLSLYNQSDTLALDTTTSDSEGFYQFEKVPTGNYSITALAEDSLAAQLNEIVISDTTTDEYILDTLWMVPPGVISGSIYGYDGMGLVLVYIPGTSYIATVNSMGLFEMTGVAPGDGYSVIFDRFGYSPVEVSDISVTSGDTVYLEAQSLTPNMYPQNFQATYDTLANVVNLTWDEMERTDIAGYIVSRKDATKSALQPVELHETLLTQTIYADTLNDTLFSRSDTIELQYQVQGQTELTGERTGYSIPVTVTAHIIRDSADLQSISVLTPSLGDTLIGLEKSDITWNYTGKIDSVKLYVTFDEGASWDPISGLIENRGVFTWQQIANIESDKCQIKVVNSANSAILGTSEQFSIALTPVENMFENGDFSNGFTGWDILIQNYDSLVDAEMVIENEELHATVTASDESWKVSFMQYPVTPLYEKYEYELKFKARATVDRKVTVNVSNFTGPYIHYADAFAMVDTTWQEYSLKFRPVGEPEYDNTVVRFFFGDGPAELWFDDISLSIVGLQ